MKNAKRVLSVLFLIFLVITACSVPAGTPGKTSPGETKKTGTGSVTIRLGTGTRNSVGSFDDVTRVYLNVYFGTTYYAHNLAMTKNNGVWETSISEVPREVNLVFDADAYNVDGVKIFSGTTVQALTTGNETVNINMVSFSNVVEIPKITKITRFAKVKLSDEAPVKVLISANTGEDVEYEFAPVVSGTGYFTPSSGTLTMPAVTETIETVFTPESLGIHYYSISLTNSIGNSIKTNFNIETVENHIGTDVILSFPPTIASISSVVSGSDIIWTAAAQDDGPLSEITYNWEFNNSTAIFADASVNPAVMQNYTEDMEGEVKLTITDKNGNGLSNTVTFNMEAGHFTTTVEEPRIKLTNIQSINISRPRDCESFTIGADTYLAIASHSNTNNTIYNVSSSILKWNGSTFVEVQTIGTFGAHEWESFTINGDTFLAVANYTTNGSSSNTNSVIYKWNGSAFREFQTIPTNGAAAWESFTIGNDVFLAVANHRNNSNHDINSKIYKWVSGEFVLYQEIPTNGDYDIEAFTIGNEYYIAVANSYSSSFDSYNIDSKIYKWDGTVFQEFQAIPSYGARDWESFTIGSDFFLVLANYRSDSGYETDSKIYKWNGTGFVEFQSITTIGARDWEPFNIGMDYYLAVANETDGSTYVNSAIYKWDGSNFVEDKIVNTRHASDWEVITIDGNLYLCIVNITNWNINILQVDRE